MTALCSAPGCARAALEQCSACQAAVYCGGECQAADWTRHQGACRQQQLLGASARRSTGAAAAVPATASFPESALTLIPVANTANIALFDTATSDQLLPGLGTQLDALPPLPYDGGGLGRGYMYEVFGDEQLTAAVPLNEEPFTGLLSVTLSIWRPARRGEVRECERDRRRAGDARVCARPRPGQDAGAPAKARVRRLLRETVTASCLKNDAVVDVDIARSQVRQLEWRRRGLREDTVGVSVPLTLRPGDLPLFPATREWRGADATGTIDVVLRRRFQGGEARLEIVRLRVFLPSL